MAKTGLRYPVYKTATTAGVIGKLIEADIKLKLNEEEIWADDDLDEYDNSFISAALTIKTNDVPGAVQSDLLGHTIVDGVTKSNIRDEAKFIQFGFYGEKKVDGVYKYRAIWLLKVKFNDPDETFKTSGENKTFDTHQMVGKVFKDANGDWKNEETFDTAAEAKVWLDSLAGVTPQCTKPSSSVASGTYAVAQSVVLTAGAGETIYYTTDGLTPTADDTAYTEAIAISASTMLKAIAVDDGKNDSQVAAYEIIISA